MIAVFSYNRNLNEQIIIEKGCRKETAKRTDEKLEVTAVLTQEQLTEIKNTDQLIDLIYYEVKCQSDVDYLKYFRSKEPKAMLMILTSSSISPTHYLKPGIAPDMLLLRPFGQEEFDEVNSELFDAFLEGTNTVDPQEIFVLNTRDGKLLIPYNKISYFEACNKKIHARVGNQEYDFYDSIENILDTVPEYFIRCHRSYLVNTKKIRKVSLSEGMIEMEKGIALPVSRTYRQSIKKLIQ